MPGSAPSYAARPEDAQCYNCGASGHWAIACPEPTRETPAGLAAWRSNNNTGRGANNRDQHGGPKKSKGPIITKYAPPPTSGPTVNHYGPPPGYGQPPGPYPGPPPPFPPQYPPHSAPVSSYPPSYPPPSYSQSYPPSSYPNPPLPPPPRPPPGQYGLPPNLPHSPHLPHPPHPPGPTHLYPPTYGPPPTTQPPQPYSSHPPYGSSYPQPFSYSHPPPFPPSYSPPPPPPTYGLPPGPRSGPPPGPPPRPLARSSPLPRHGPPSISALPTPGTSHSLPPRPPRIHRDVHEPPRDSRNKRKHDRHNRNRENRQKKSNVRSQLPVPKAKSGNGQHGSKAKTVSKSPVASQHEELPPPKAVPKPTSEVSSTISDSKINDPATPPVDKGSPNKQNDTPDDLSEIDDGEWEVRTIFKELEPPHAPDEVGKPLPASYSERVLLPRKWDAKCIDSEFVKPDNLEEYIQPIHEKPYWNLVEFDPAFIRDGRLPCGDPLPKLLLRVNQPDRSNSSENGEGIEREQKREHSSSRTPEERPLKRQRSNSPSYNSPRGGEDNAISESLWDNYRPRIQKGHRSEEPDRRNTDLLDITHRRSPGRRQSYERGRSRTRSPSSRRSSVSNASSGLDSLEAELLGRPDKAKSPDTTTKRRQSSGSNNRPRKRQPRLDAAYSRRW